MEKTNAEWIDLAKRYLKEMDIFTFTNMQTAVIAECLKQYESERKNDINTSEPHLQLGDVIKLVCFTCNTNERVKGERYCKSCFEAMNQTVL